MKKNLNKIQRLTKPFFTRASSILTSLQIKISKKPTITIWGEMVSGPYGGGSQFLKALAKELTKQGYHVLNNSLYDSDGHILNSAFFNVEQATHVITNSKKKPRVVHRIDGPVSRYRGSNCKEDDKIFSLNKKLATTTAFQSDYSWKECMNLGFQPCNPIIIRNACNPLFFYKKETPESFLQQFKKTKIISTSWSSNMNKGFETYQYLDEHLDFSHYEYLFVGRSPVVFKNIKMCDAVGSKKLGSYLRQAHIYITASINDPASNSLLEALTCGLPALYLNSGGHAEIVKSSGISFESAGEVPNLLKKIESNYLGLKKSIQTTPIKEVARKYIEALKLE